MEKKGFFEGINNNQLAYSYNSINNKNPTIIFIHGLGSDYSSWRKQCKFLLKNKYSIARFDLLGHGKSDSPPDYKSYSLENSTNNLKKFVEFLNCEDNFVLVGHCLGASIIQLFENKFPNKTKMLFILSGTHKKVNKLISKILKYYFKLSSFRKKLKLTNQAKNIETKL